MIVALLNFYYIIVLAWGIFYLSYSFSWDLAWSSCNNTWNTGSHGNAEGCRERWADGPTMERDRQMGEGDRWIDR